MYDARAAVHEKQGNYKLAVRDGRQSITFGPQRWQGYRRVAHAALSLRRYNDALRFIDMATERAGNEQVQKDLATLRRTISQGATHVSQLPVELLTEIFTLVLNDDDTRTITLSHVSMHWRSVVQQSSNLWSTLILSKRSPVAKTRLWIQRSRGRIRTLSLRESLQENLDWSFSLLRGLNWTGLERLHAAEMEIYKGLKSVCTSQLPLQLLELDIQDRIVKDSPATITQDRDSLCSLLNFSHLRSVTCHAWQLSRRIFQEPTHLRSVALHSLVASPRLSDIVHLLSQNLELEVIDFGFRFIIDLSTGDQSRLILPRVNRFEMRRFDRAQSLVTLFEFPSLQTLILANFSSSIDVILTTLASDGLQRLTELCIDKCPLTSPPLIELLVRNPNLETLSLTSLSKIANPVVKRMVSPIGEPEVLPACPKLRTLNLSNHGDLETLGLKRLVRSRNCVEGDGTVKVEALILDGCPLIEAESLDWFRSNVSQFSCIYMTRKQANYRR